jgi:hypothetical protein
VQRATHSSQSFGRSPARFNDSNKEHPNSQPASPGCTDARRMPAAFCLSASLYVLFSNLF